MGNLLPIWPSLEGQPNSHRRSDWVWLARLMRAEVNRCSIVCNPKVLAGKGQTVTALRGVLFTLGGNCH